MYNAEHRENRRRSWFEAMGERTRPATRGRDRRVEGWERDFGPVAFNSRRNGELLPPNYGQVIGSCTAERH